MGATDTGMKTRTHINSFLSIRHLYIVCAARATNAADLFPPSTSLHGFGRPASLAVEAVLPIRWQRALATSKASERKHISCSLDGVV